MATQTEGLVTTARKLSTDMYNQWRNADESEPAFETVDKRDLLKYIGVLKSVQAAFVAAMKNRNSIVAMAMFKGAKAAGALIVDAERLLANDRANAGWGYTVMNMNGPEWQQLQSSAPMVPKKHDAKAAAVIKAAKAVGVKRVKRVKALDPAIRGKIAGYVTRMRASAQRGYINIADAQGLRQLLNTTDFGNVRAGDMRELVMAASDIVSILAKQPGEQMKEVSDLVSSKIDTELRTIVAVSRQL